jgi:hypothetical protein
MARAINAILTLKDRFTPTIQRIAQQTGQTERAIRRASNTITSFQNNAVRSFKNVAKNMALVSGAGVIGSLAIFKAQLLDPMADYERQLTVLKTLTGSFSGAKSAMSWISKFAQQTPYELNDVQEAFIKLKSYGLDPTHGLLKTLGDTSSAMGKPIIQAVEAIADAVTGENERLKEFGIIGSKSGGKVSYAYTDRNGKQEVKTVDANNRKIIQSTLEAIMNDKYKGAMKDQSSTWNGMMSNMSDTWANFRIQIMQNGVFDLLKNSLTSLLTKINEMASNGSLTKLAKEIGTDLKDGIVGTYKAIKFLHDNMNWLIPVTVTLLGSLMAFKAVTTVITILETLQGVITACSVAGGVWNAIMLANPLTWIAIGVVALVAGLVLLAMNWDKVTNAVQNAINRVKEFYGLKKSDQTKANETDVVKGMKMSIDAKGNYSYTPTNANKPNSTNTNNKTNNNNKSINVTNHIHVKGSNIDHKKLVNDVGHHIVKNIKNAQAVI